MTSPGCSRSPSRLNAPRSRDHKLAVDPAHVVVFALRIPQHHAVAPLFDLAHGYACRKRSSLSSEPDQPRL